MNRLTIAAAGIVALFCLANVGYAGQKVAPGDPLFEDIQTKRTTAAAKQCALALSAAETLPAGLKTIATDLAPLQRFPFMGQGTLQLGASPSLDVLNEDNSPDREPARLYLSVGQQGEPARTVWFPEATQVKVDGNRVSATAVYSLGSGYTLRRRARPGFASDLFNALGNWLRSNWEGSDRDPIGHADLGSQQVDLEYQIEDGRLVFLRVKQSRIARALGFPIQETEFEVILK